MDYSEFISCENFTEGMTKEQIEYARDFAKRRADELTRVCVIYHPNCGCEIDQFVILDRYPMSEKIISRCPECNKGVLMEISDPIIFYLPLTEEEFSLKDLKNCVITETPQGWILEKYMLEANQLS